MNYTAQEVTIKDVSLLVDCLTTQITMQRLTFVWYASRDLCFAVEKTISLFNLNSVATTTL